VIFGWGITILFLVIVPLYDVINGGDYGSSILYSLLMTGFILSIRYSMMKPFFKAVSGDAKVVGIVYIFESLFVRKNQQGSATLGAFVGAMLVLIFLLLKNAVVGLIYLIRETIDYIRLLKQQSLNEVAPSKEN
jgi:hypothetical protein